MKQSKYNVLFKMENSDYLLGNLLSGALSVIPDNQISIIKNILEGKLSKVDDQQLICQMEDEGYIIPDDFNEIDIIKYHYWQNKMDNRYFVLSIITSYNCDLNCVYCFQQNNRKETNSFISSDILKRIPLLIKNKIEEGFKTFTIGWDGGEASLSLDKIAEIGVEIKNICDKNDVTLYQDFATNGYSLNEDKIKLLDKIGVTTLAITLAGNQKEHDELRKTVDGKDTFEHILENIRIAKAVIPNILIIVNVTKTNVDSMYGLIDRFNELKLNDNVFFNFKRVMPYDIEKLENLCLPKMEYNKAVVSLQRYCRSKNIEVGNTHIITPTFSHCLAGRKNSFAIDFNGNLYKCLECCENPIGYINEFGELVLAENDDVVDIFLDNKCINCIQLPCCAGGCLTKRKSNLDYCPSESGSEKEYLLFEYDDQNFGS